METYSTYTNQGYILGNACEYEPYAHVFTFDRFLETLMQGKLPPYRSWIVGQGVTTEERDLLRRLHQAWPEMHFVMPVIEAWHNPSARTSLHHVRIVEPYYYQADVYFSPFHSPQAASEKLTPVWEVVGNTASQQGANRLSSDGARLVEALEALTVEGLQSVYPKGFIAIKDFKLHQVRKIFPLAVSLEVQLFRSAYANSYAKHFSAKGRFYQDEFCLAEANFHVEIETEENVIAKDTLAASRAFGHELAA